MPEQVDRPNAVMRGGLHALVGLAHVLGPARYGVADSIAMAAYALDGSRRRNTQRNHRRLAPHIDEREARRRARVSFREYGRTTADFFWASGMDDAQVRRRSTVEGMEHVDAALARGSGAVVALSHYGSWDMGALAAAAREMPLTTVMADVGSRAFTDLVRWARRRNQLDVHTPQNAARALLRALKQNRCVGLMSDIPDAGPTVDVAYCGGLVPFSTVPAWLALRTGAPLLAAECTRQPGGHFAVVIHPPVAVHEGDDERAVMQRVAAVLERAVRERPGQWYPFGDVYAEAPSQHRNS